MLALENRLIFISASERLFQTDKVAVKILERNPHAVKWLILIFVFYLSEWWLEEIKGTIMFFGCV